MVKTAGAARFEDERSFDDSDALRISPADFLHPLILVVDHGRMDNCVEFLKARGPAAWGAKPGFGQPRTVDASIGIQDFAAKAADDFLIDRATRLHKRVRDGICLDQVSAEFDKYLADN